MVCKQNGVRIFLISTFQLTVCSHQVGLYLQHGGVSEQGLTSHPTFRRRTRQRGFGSILSSMMSLHCNIVAALTLRLRNDLYCVEWGVKLYSLTHSSNTYF